MTDYTLLQAQVRALTENVPHKIANLANAAALLWEYLDTVNWTGFYLLEGDTLVLGPFQGKAACIEIPVGKGVCGSAVERKETLVVSNVHEFPGHIACDCASNSEIVIPLYQGHRIIGVLDIDSPIKNRFSEEDRIGLEEFCQILERNI